MIEVTELTKMYGKTEAVKGLSFSVEAGSVYGFVGPNGAGKTTTLRVLATLLAPTSGTASINGHRIDREPQKVRSSVGYMPDFFGVYDDLKVSEYLDFFQASCGVPARERAAIQRDLLELVDLSHKRDAYVDTLSRGMKQRLCLARALVHDPEVLLLDEPASGLDPRARVEIRALIRELHVMGKTIIISSHILSELSEMCTDIGIIEDGNLIYSGKIEEALLRMKSGTILFITILGESDKAESILRSNPQVENVVKKGNRLEISFTGTERDQAELLAGLVRNDIQVVEFAQGNDSLEDIFLKLTRGVVS